MLTRRGALMGGFCLCCAPALARRAAGGAVAAAAIREVAPGIFIRTGVTEDASPTNDDAIANIGFIVGRQAVAVVDPGGSLDDGESLLAALRRTTDLPIRYVVISHVHPDHVFGAGAFVADKPVFVGHAKLPAALAVRGAFYRDGLNTILGPGRAGPVVTPSLLVADRTTLDLGGRELVLTAHDPAHTDCDLSVYDPRTRVLLTGDLVFVDRAPSLDGDLKGWRRQLAAMRRVPAVHAVPGHGPNLIAWPDGASAIEEYLAVLETQTRRAVAADVPIEQATTQVAQSERGKWTLFDAYNPRNVLEAYRQLEWE